MSEASGSAKPLKRARRAFYGTRSRLSEFFNRTASIRVSPAYRGVRWLSAIILTLLAVQIFTGVLLSLYYYPEPGVAHASVRYLSTEVTAGWLIRAMHHWAGDLLVVTVVFHLVVVFFRRAYRWPREYEWVVGVLLFPAVLAFRFTGRLLPWDTTGFAATRRGLDLFEDLPVIGSFAARWLRGGEDMGANTLSRFFSTHVLILPWLVLFFIAIHLYLIRRHGLREDDQ